MRVFGHWVEGAWSEALALGIRGCWVNADAIPLADLWATVDACPDWRYILTIYPTEARLRDGDRWRREMGHAIGALEAAGLTGACAGIQFGDEWWTALYAGGLASSPHWPSLQGLSPARAWALRWTAADLWGQRAADLRAVWREVTGAPCPPIGMAETGACHPPEFVGQDWWGVNGYFLPGGMYASRGEDVQRLYRLVWAGTTLPIMPVIGVFEEPGTHLPDVAALEACYAPIVAHPRTWAVGLFCVHHPSAYDARHGAGRGVLQLPAAYGTAVGRWCRALAGRV